jgi:hypothetical protein
VDVPRRHFASSRVPAGPVVGPSASPESVAEQPQIREQDERRGRARWNFQSAGENGPRALARKTETRQSIVRGRHGPTGSRSEARGPAGGSAGAEERDAKRHRPSEVC